MVGARTVSGLILAGAGLMTFCSSLAEIDARPVARRWHSDRMHPVAALAWAQSHCDADLTLSPGTPRLQAEDLLQMSAVFDLAEREQGRAAAFTTATALAAGVSTEAAPSNVSRQGLVASIR
jgi:hypothetical protein